MVPSPHPLFGGVPGGPELLVILLIFVLPAVLVLYLFVQQRGEAGGSDEVERLRERVDELESELDREREDND